MRKFILSALATTALVVGSSSAFAGYWMPNPNGPYFAPIYVPTYSCMPGAYGPICGMN
ncbi:hypothetical protein [Methylobacterium sp. CM6244]